MQKQTVTLATLTEKPFISLRDVRELLGITREQMENLITEKRLPVVSFGPRSRRIPATAIREFLDTV
jgi:excisionase family DNA binding protein